MSRVTIIVWFMSELIYMCVLWQSSAIYVFYARVTLYIHSMPELSYIHIYIFYVWVQLNECSMPELAICVFYVCLAIFVCFMFVCYFVWLYICVFCLFGQMLLDWINDVLADDRIIVKDIEEDLFDGQILQKLIGENPPPPPIKLLSNYSFLCANFHGLSIF